MIFLMCFYQGLNDRARERGYSWVDNSPVNYVNWRDGEPNDHTGYENCIEMQTRSGQWNDLPCTIWRQFMCKKNIGENIHVIICGKTPISKMYIYFSN